MFSYYVREGVTARVLAQYCHCTGGASGAHYYPAASVGQAKLWLCSKPCQQDTIGHSLHNINVVNAAAVGNAVCPVMFML